MAETLRDARAARFSVSLSFSRSSTVRAQRACIHRYLARSGSGGQRGGA